MSILYAPDGTPYEVPHTEVNSFLRQGYRTSKPQESEVSQSSLLIDTTKTGGIGTGKEANSLGGTPQRQATDLVPSLGEADGSWENTYHGEPIKVNSASLKELTGLPGVGTATARKVIDLRPYKSAEDLIAKVDFPSGSWLAIADKLDFAEEVSSDK